jgi:DNA-directed RNA polymerase subunit H
LRVCSNHLSAEKIAALFYFRVNPLASSIKNHFLVPKHYLLPEAQAQKLLEEFSLKPDQLPMIRKDDAAIKDLKPRAGDIVKIVRNSQTAGQTVYYRRVV